MVPFQFGTGERRLFGVHHDAAAAGAGAVSVLLCNPFGQEAIRLHRFYRVLADRLARNGIHVLRFDPYGTGDSMGADDALSVDGWQGDVLTAHDELLRRAPSAAVHWVSARFGAAIAMLAARQAPRKPASLTLWDPVLDGAAYRQRLRRNHADALAVSYGLIGPDWRAMLDDDQTFRDEVIGFSVSPALDRGMRETDLRTAIPVEGAATRVLGDPADPVLSEWLTHCRNAGAAVDFTPLVHDFDWTAEEAANAALVPPKALQYFVSTLTG